jgi:predicted PurR-regulated permease PerM
MPSPDVPSESRPVTREGLVRAGLVAWSIIGFLLLIFIAVRLLYEVREIFPPLVLALALLFLLNPLVSRLERRGVGRAIGTIVIYLLFLTAVILVGVALAPTMRAQFQELAERFPELVDSAIASAQNIASQLGLPLDQEQVTAFTDRLREQALTGLGRITQFAGGALHLVFIVILAPILALYLLIDLPRLSRSFVSLIPDRYRVEWLALLERCGQAVGGFFRGQLLVAAIVGFLSAAALAIVGIPFWLPIGLIAGFFNLIPLIGPFIGGAIAVVVGAVEGGLVRAVLAGLAMLAVQQIDNHFISPYVMGRVLRMHPVTVIVALLAGGTLAGLWGMLLAVPATAVAKIVFMHYYSTRVLGRALEAELVSPDAEPVAQAPEVPGEAERQAPAPTAANRDTVAHNQAVIPEALGELEGVLTGASGSSSPGPHEAPSMRRASGSVSKPAPQTRPRPPSSPHRRRALTRLTRPIGGGILRQFFRRLLRR